MAVGAPCKLFVKHLPSLLNYEDKEDLLKHFGAREVICMGRRGKMRNAAFAVFSDEAEAAKALSRLHQLDVLGNRLVVEFAKKHHEKLAAQECSRISPPREMEAEEKEKKEGKADSSETLDEHLPTDWPSVGIAPKLGLNYGPNPALHYLYPTPNAAILTNIAHSLACVPKFYVQVLHLMNKLNLPAPFGPVTVVPPIISETIISEQQVTLEDDRVLSSEESEIESDEEERERRAKERAVVAPKGTASKPVKPEGTSRKRPSGKLQPTQTKKPKTGPPSKQPLESAFEQPTGQQTRKIAFKLTDAITSIFEFGPPSVETADAAQSEGFGKFEPPPEPVVMEMSEEPLLVEESNEFISRAELDANRMSDKEIRSMSSFKNYAAGEPTSRLYIKNLAKQVEEKDLRYIFGRYTRNSSEEEKDRFDIRLMKEGRMKGQAFVTLPSEEWAKRALREVHGYILQGKPIVIQFARSAKARD